MKIFISWSGRRGAQIANALADWLNKFFETEGEHFVSTKAIRAGARWNEVINAALREASYGILCLTPENLTAPWILFEAGALSKTVGEAFVCPYLHELLPHELRRPLEQFNSARADKDGTYALVRSINEKLEKRFSNTQLDINFTYWWPFLESELKKVSLEQSDLFVQISKLQKELNDTIDKVKESEVFRSNNYFAFIALRNARQFATNLQNAGPYFDCPLTLYPSYLVSILKEFKANVKAIALVDAVERFWPQKEGEAILKATSSNSCRVFVFREKEHLTANIGVLMKHAKKYHVYALSFNKLASEFAEYVDDFSIIGGTQTPLLAYYHEPPTTPGDPLPIKEIRFSAVPSEISEHEDAINNIIEFATPVPSSFDVENLDSLEGLVDSVFKPESRHFERKTVEMSKYIEVLDYDLHEEEHAYYRQMMDQMIKIMKEARRDASVTARVLELGAGTGIFTKRLAMISNLDITALEIDWACVQLLQKNIEALSSEMSKSNTRFEFYNEDSRSFNPPGRFDYIVSSFADHHIHFVDKVQYFRNIKRNLNDNGLFIVGDEFLPTHDEEKPDDRTRALEIYHNHIINIANQEGYPRLAKLEARALESGKKGWGDFKITCQRYLNQIDAAGLDLIGGPNKIGPMDLSDVGGVYVLTFKRKAI